MEYKFHFYSYTRENMKLPKKSKRSKYLYPNSARFIGRNELLLFLKNV